MVRCVTPPRGIRSGRGTILPIRASAGAQFICDLYTEWREMHERLERRRTCADDSDVNLYCCVNP